MTDSCDDDLGGETPQTSAGASDGSETPLTAEDQAAVDSVLEELVARPPFSCQITFNWHGDEERADRASLMIRLHALMLRRRHPHLDFSCLKSIVFHHDYELALHEVSGGRPGFEPTKEAGGLSVGMMVSEPDGAHLVMTEGVALGLVSGDPVQQDFCSHLVRHELCHVDDYRFKLELIARNPAAARPQGYEAHMARPAFSLWDEYYANKYSQGVGSDAQVSAYLVRDSLPTLRAEVTESILRYRVHGDLETLLAEVEPKVRFAAQCFGYLAGSLDAEEKALAAAYPDVAQLLEKLGLTGAWDMCFAAVQKTDAERLGFADASGFGILFPAVQKLFSGFGLDYTSTPRGAHVHVPFTTDTNPLLASLRSALKFGLS